MQFTKMVVQRVREVSFAVDQWLDSEAYLLEYDDQSDNYSIEHLFPRILEMVLRELKDLGIRVHMDIEEIYDNPILISGIVSLRELFDRNNLRILVDKKPEVRSMIQGVLDSVDVEDGQHAAVLTGILLKHTAFPQDRGTSIERLEDAYTSSQVFCKHISACMDSVMTTQKVSDAAFSAYVKVGKAVHVLWIYWQQLADVLYRDECNPIHPDNLKNYFDQYAAAWLNINQASSWNWALSITPLELKENENNILAQCNLVHIWKSINPYSLSSILRKKTFSLDELTVFYLGIALEKWVYYREPLTSYKNLMIPCNSTPECYERSIEIAEAAIANRLKDNRSLSAVDRDGVLQWNSQIASSLRTVTTMEM